MALSWHVPRSLCDAFQLAMRGSCSMVTQVRAPCVAHAAAGVVMTWCGKPLGQV
jgi:hypothetical protein